MNYDRTCNTCRYHDEGMCYCPKSEEFRDVTVTHTAVDNTKEAGKKPWLRRS